MVLCLDNFSPYLYHSRATSRASMNDFSCSYCVIFPKIFDDGVVMIRGSDAAFLTRRVVLLLSVIDTLLSSQHCTLVLHSFSGDQVESSFRVDRFSTILSCSSDPLRKTCREFRKSSLQLPSYKLNEFHASATVGLLKLVFLRVFAPLLPILELLTHF